MTLPALLARIRHELLEEIPSALRTTLVFGTDEDGHRGYIPIERSDPPRAETLAVRARYDLDLARWAHYTYQLDADGYWRCELPWRRACDRLASSSFRRAMVFWALLDGRSPSEAWKDYGEPSDPERASLALVRTVISFAEQEMSAEREHRPRDEGRCPCLACKHKRAEAAERRRASIIETMRRSESQEIAEAMA